MILLIFLLFLVSIPFLILAYGIVRGIRKKNKKHVIVLSSVLLALILIPGYFLRILPGSNFLWKPYDRYQERQHNFQLTGFEFNEGISIYKYETERAFNGDGYSIWINKINDETVEYFKNPSTDFFKQYPSKSIRSDWQHEVWKRTPFNKEEKKFLDFAHHSLTELEFELEDLLNENGNYYSYQYKMLEPSDGKSMVWNIDFQIICPKRKMIVTINHNQ